MARSDATANRAALIAAARIELNADPSASLETIAVAAGLSRRSVYGHFASRDDLLRELLTTGSQRVSAALAARTADDPLLDLALIAAHLWREVETMRVMALFAVRGPFKHLTADNLGPLRARVLDDIVRGQEQGGIRSDIDAATLAHLIEEGALMVLDEATAQPFTAEQGHTLAIRVVLGLAGLGWREANTFIESHSELAFEES
jgi:AcrR family transcriptional regulator